MKYPKLRKIVAIILLILIIAELLALVYFMLTGQTSLMLTALVVNGITVILAYFIIRFDKFNRENK